MACLVRLTLPSIIISSALSIVWLVTVDDFLLPLSKLWLSGPGKAPRVCP